MIVSSTLAKHACLLIALMYIINVRMDQRLTLQSALQIPETCICIAVFRHNLPYTDTLGEFCEFTLMPLRSRQEFRLAHDDANEKRPAAI